MKLFTFWQQWADSEWWCVGAWDEHSVDENREGYEQNVRELEEANSQPGQQFKIVEIEVDGATLEASLNALPSVEGEVK